MDYKCIYDKIIERAKNESRKKNNGIYYERHHILPKCLGGLDNKLNLVLLTGREHFICHKLLVKIYPDNKSIWYASSMMICMKSGNRGYIVTSREYEYNMIILAKNMSEDMKGKPAWNKGIKMSKEFCKKDSEANKGRISPNKGKRMSEEQYKNLKIKVWDNKECIEKIRKSNIGKIVSKETLIKLSESHKGIYPSKETRIKLSLSHIGFVFSEDSKRKISNSQKGKVIPREQIIKRSQSYFKRPILTCPWCGVRGRGSGISKYHFDNCKCSPNYIEKEDNREILVCNNCGFKSKNKGAMVLWHFDNCKLNKNIL